MTMTVCPDWRDLPFREIWCVDTEFYPGPGKANGGVEGDASTPLCLVAHEMRSGRVVRLWQDEFGPFPPHRLDDSALFIAFTNSAEFGTHISLGWGGLVCSLDLYLEFRHFMNNGAAESSDRGKGFFSLAGALRCFGDDGLDLTHKKDMRDRIIQGPPFTHEERREILEYCESDVDALVRLVPHLIPTIRTLPHAEYRAEYAWAIAQEERRGVPIDQSWLSRICEYWDGIRTDLTLELDEFGIYEIANGKPHWRKERFAEFIQRNNMSWPKLESGALDETDQTFREMEGKYSFIGPLRELRYSLSKLKLNDLHVGSDGRNRTLLSPYGTKTARNTPSNSKYVFGPAKWIRFLIAPPPGLALIHRDFCQQEVRIAAILSGDKALMEACLSGDVYLGLAEKLGFISESMSMTELEDVRKLFKTVVLGILYGLGAETLAVRAGITLYEAAEILARLRARFRVFFDYLQHVLDHAGILLEVSTPYGWTMQCPPTINPRTASNFPIQSTGAEILHVLSIIAERRGIEIVAPVHDAVMAQAPLDQVRDVSAALDRLMRDASAVVSRGHELPTDEQLIGKDLHHERYYDKRGVTMWDTVTKLVDKLEREKAEQQERASQ
jgi:DNA polymerase family A